MEPFILEIEMKSLKGMEKAFRYEMMAANMKGIGKAIEPMAKEG